MSQGKSRRFKKQLATLKREHRPASWAWPALGRVHELNAWGGAAILGSAQANGRLCLSNPPSRHDGPRAPAGGGKSFGLQPPHRGRSLPRPSLAQPFPDCAEAFFCAKLAFFRATAQRPHDPQSLPPLGDGVRLPGLLAMDRNLQAWARKPSCWTAWSGPGWPPPSKRRAWTNSSRPCLRWILPPPRRPPSAAFELATFFPRARGQANAPL